MTDITDFLMTHPLDARTGQFPLNELEAYKHKLPQELYEFLQQEQKSVYGNGFFRTVSPKDFHDVLGNWGLDGNNCHAFLVSSFGCIAYYHNEKFYVLNPHIALSTTITGNIFDLAFNIVLCNTTSLSVGFYYDLHMQHRGTLSELKEDEMYTLIPAIPLGGSKETSKIEVVKMEVQLDILAQLYGNKTSK